MSTADITTRARVVAALAAFYGDAPDQYAAYVAEDERRAIEGAVQAIAAHPGDAKQHAERQLNSLCSAARFTGIAEVHPAWVLEALRGESPRVIGVILRHLPSAQVRYIIEHLPAEVRSLLPDIIEVFSIPSEVLEVIRERFERRFFSMCFVRGDRPGAFRDIAALKADELEALFHDLGIQELAMAMSSMSGRARRVLLNRLPLREAKRLQLRIRSIGEISPLMRHQALFTVIEVAGEHHGAKSLLQAIGISAFARSITTSDDALIHQIMQKLRPELGYVLKRAVAEWSEAAPTDIVQDRQRMAIDRLIALAEDQAIDPHWARQFAHVGGESAAGGQLASE